MTQAIKIFNITHVIKILENGVLRKNTRPSIMIYSIHHNPEYFPDPEAFKPERFLTQAQNKNYFSYIPFSAGSRNCIGLLIKFIFIIITPILTQ